jgi:hypothetical protein
MTVTHAQVLMWHACVGPACSGVRSSILSALSVLTFSVTSDWRCRPGSCERHVLRSE